METKFYSIFFNPFIFLKLRTVSDQGNYRSKLLIFATLKYLLPIIISTDYYSLLDFQPSINQEYFMEEWVVISNDRIIQRFIIKEGQMLFIGRGADADVAINNPSVSRKHASLELNNGFYFITDWHSTNGTWVNGVKITGTQQVPKSDLLAIGKFIIKPASLITREVDAGSIAPIASEEDSMNKTMTSVPVFKKTEVVDETLPPEKRLLTVIMGDVKPDRLVLRGKPITAGKDPSCDLVFKGMMVAKIQFSIEFRPKGYFISPGGGMLSKTLVNGKKLEDDHHLKPKDVIEVGSIKIRVA